MRGAQRLDAKYEGRDAQRLDAQHDSPVFRQRRKMAPEYSSFREDPSVRIGYVSSPAVSPCVYWYGLQRHRRYFFCTRGYGIKNKYILHD
ncbi:hypothetical protein FNU55_21100 [Salmonella enterica]|nr:hypothetical protein [Salmonella enterica]ECH7161950.1 hypothetical protein [Salmonella enterica]